MREIKPDDSQFLCLDDSIVKGYLLLQADLDGLRGHVDATNEPDHLTFLSSLLLQLVHLAIELGQLLQELVSAGNALKLLGNQALHGEAGRALDGQTGQTGENGQLSRNVEAVQVITRIRLGVAQLLGLLDLGGEGATAAADGHEAVEEEGHGAGEDALDLGHLVARLDQLLERRDDRQAGADAALVEDEAAGAGAVAGGAVDGLPQRIRGGEGLLVGGDDADALLEEERVGVGDVLVRGVVDEDDFAGGGAQVVGDLDRVEGGGVGGGEVFLPGGQAQGAVVGAVEDLAAAGEQDQGEVGRSGRGLGEARSDGVKLVKEAFSNSAGTWRVVSARTNGSWTSGGAGVRTDDGDEDLARRRHCGSN